MGGVSVEDLAVELADRYGRPVQSVLPMVRRFLLALREYPAAGGRPVAGADLMTAAAAESVRAAYRGWVESQDPGPAVSAAAPLLVGGSTSGRYRSLLADLEVMARVWQGRGCRCGEDLRAVLDRYA